MADEPVLRQSTRRNAYDAAFDQLRIKALAFPCRCSRSALTECGVLHRDGLCMAPPHSQRSPLWPVRVPDISVSFVDALQGPQLQNLRETGGDFGIRCADGSYACQLTRVVGDAHQRASEVVSGADLLDSTF